MNKASKSAPFLVAIRSADERTVEACFEIVKSQADGAPVHLVSEVPFKKALEECFRLAINSEKRWLITVDADMILLPGAIHLLVREAEKMPDTYLQIQGRILDKITGTVRKAGPRIYRVSLLPKLLELSESMKDHIRPESRLITHAGRNGWPSRYIPAVMALHDFEQYYKDIYRKSFVHARKHPDLLPDMIQRAVLLKDKDPDYLVMLQAIWDSLIENVEVGIDTRLYTETAEKALNKLNLVEKEDSLTDPAWEVHKEEIKDLPEIYLQNNLVPYSDSPAEKAGHMSLKKLSSDGIKGIFHRIGGRLIKLGKKLQMY